MLTLVTRLKHIFHCLFLHCPGSGRFLGVRRDRRWKRILWAIPGILALAYYLARVLPKPSRAAYPCTRAAGGIVAGALGYAAGFGVAAALFHKARGLFLRARYACAVAAGLIGIAAAVSGIRVSAQMADAAVDPDTGKPVPQFVPETANTPIGVAQGIKPGRVAWAYDAAAAHWNGSGRWCDAGQNDQTRINTMLDSTVMSVGDKTTVAAAWDAIFRSYNVSHGRGNAGYAAGEKIAVKINLNNNGDGTGVDASPQMVYALLNQLVKQVGVSASAVTFYDNMKLASAHNIIKNYCSTAFPGVQYVGSDTAQRQAGSFTFSGGGLGTTGTALPKALIDATYLVNMALLKRHMKQPDSTGWNGNLGQTGVTLCGKNHCGTSDNCGALHATLRQWNKSGPSFNPFVDFMATKKVGGKTVLYIVDGLYSGDYWGSTPKKWSIAPFNGGWPSSVFVSQDPVAIDSVGLDFIRNQWWVAGRADNYMHEAAQVGSAPSGTAYAPDGTRVTTSLGAHEHWNNSTDRKYSRNLDPVNGKGIELVRVSLTPSTCTNNIKDGSETDVDCGGSLCSKCATGKRCTVASDCASNTCTGGVCVQSFVTITSVSTGKAYKLTPASLGATAYIDRTYTMTSIATALQKGTLVQTANDDKAVTTTSHLTLSLAQAATVYVGYDKRGTPPTWLTSAYTLGTEALSSSEANGNPMRVYRKSFPAGTVTLGGNAAAGSSGAYNNYVVVIVP